MLPNLPREIWLDIGKCLESRLDPVRFRSVCRTWRSSLPPPFRFPLRVPHPPGPSRFRKKYSYFITEVTFYSANDMIVVFEEEYRGGEFSASAFVHLERMPTKEFELPLETGCVEPFRRSDEQRLAALPGSAGLVLATLQALQGNRKVLHLVVVSEDLYMFLHEPTIRRVTPRLYKLSSRLGQWLEAEEDLPDQVFIQNPHCNFPVAESLVRRCCYKSNDNGVEYEVPHFCSWPEFNFVRVAVDFRNEYQSPEPYRYCDIASLPYFTRATTPQTHPN